MADDYQAEHGPALASDLVWGPEGLTEAVAGLLGPVAGRRVLEVGCGAAQCSRWLRAAGAEPIGIDLSARMLDHSRLLDRAGSLVPVVHADARSLPFAGRSFDLAFTSYGALPFVADPEAVHLEVARVLRPGSRWVFSTSHPFRWVFPDDPGPAGLTATMSYFDRRPYVERDDSGRAVYVEHHATIGQQVRALRGAGFTVDDIVEPEWPTGRSRTWGGWSALRGERVPGTAIYVCLLP